jgi:hypothetical protein
MLLTDLQTEEQMTQAVEVALFLQTVTVQVLADGRAVQIYPLTFGRARIAIGAPGDPEGLHGYNDVW